MRNALFINVSIYSPLRAAFLPFPQVTLEDLNLFLNNKRTLNFLYRNHAFSLKIIEMSTAFLFSSTRNWIIACSLLFVAKIFECRVNFSVKFHVLKTNAISPRFYVFSWSESDVKISGWRMMQKKIPILPITQFFFYLLFIKKKKTLFFGQPTAYIAGLPDIAARHMDSLAVKGLKVNYIFESSTTYVAQISYGVVQTLLIDGLQGHLKLVKSSQKLAKIA